MAEDAKGLGEPDWKRGQALDAHEGKAAVVLRAPAGRPRLSLCCLGTFRTGRESP